MRKIMLIAAVALCATATAADAKGVVSTRGYVRVTGVYVAPHVQTAPNSTRLDNYSTKGNVNPYTGTVGTVNPYAPRKPH